MRREGAPTSGQHNLAISKPSDPKASGHVRAPAHRGSTHGHRCAVRAGLRTIPQWRQARTRQAARSGLQGGQTEKHWPSRWSNSNSRSQRWEAPSSGPSPLARVEGALSACRAGSCKDHAERDPRPSPREVPKPPEALRSCRQAPRRCGTRHLRQSNVAQPLEGHRTSGPRCRYTVGEPSPNGQCNNCSAGARKVTSPSPTAASRPTTAKSHTNLAHHEVAWIPRKIGTGSLVQWRLHPKTVSQPSEVTFQPSSSKAKRADMWAGQAKSGRCEVPRRSVFQQHGVRAAKAMRGRLV